MSRSGCFTINGFWRHDDRKTKGSAVGPVAREQKDLKFLCACFVDLDFYKVGLKFDKTKQRLLNMAKEGIIPKPSILADSGRGLWAFWLLHRNGNKKLPPKGDPVHNSYYFRLWGRVQEGLINPLRGLGSGSPRYRVPRI